MLQKYGLCFRITDVKYVLTNMELEMFKEKESAIKTK